ncbi:MAG: TOBE domain-containing protein [Thermoplasmata archaeon]|nr:TOBE domain-containing protein [Thermoplasmata archaeon]
MSDRASVVTDTDVALLRSLAQERSVVAASRSVGISRDRAIYRLARLERAFGGPVVAAVRGGRAHGGTLLTALGDRIVRQGFDSVELLAGRPVAPLSLSNRLEGVFHRAPGPEVELGPGLRLRVAFAAEEGEPVAVLVDPEAILVARGQFPSSARNVLPGIVAKVERSRGVAGRTLLIRSGRVTFRVAVTEEPIRQLHLTPGTRVWLYVKATAVRRVSSARPTRGSLRS